MDKQINISWPGWETVKLIGRGSFGEVYEIQREIRGRTEHAALKVISIPHNESEIGELKADGYDDESITQYFTDSLEKIEDEYAMMADLKGHSNVVYCDDIRTVQHDDGFGWDIYIKMELLVPLKSYLSNEVTDTQIIKLGMDICDALKLCEELNIVHRDIKPENIFVSRNGNFKLGDFGIAKTMEGTTGGTKTGTYDYMSPEVYNNLPYRTQADIYSLGLVMYWLMNERTAPFLLQKGKKPTPSEKSIARDRRFFGERIPAPKDGSAELKRIVLKACAFDPKDRYQTAREMWEDLARLSSGYTEEFVPDPEPFSDPIIMDECDDDKTVGPVFDHIQAVDTEAWEKTVGPVFSTKAQNGTEDLDVRQTLRFAYEDNPAGRTINVQVGAETKQVWIPEQFENGQTFYYEGMGLKSAYSEVRGNLYLSVQVAPVPTPNTKTPTPYVEHQKKKWPLLLGMAVIVFVICFFTIHIWTDPTCTEPATCSICGKIAGSALGHRWAAATCTQPATCFQCGKIDGLALGHQWMEATKALPETCEKCGLTKGSPIQPTLEWIQFTWDGEGNPQATAQDAWATLSCSEWEKFPESKITIQNARDEVLPRDCFEFAWVNKTVWISPSGGLDYGVYHITFAGNDERITYSLCYGYKGDIYQQYSSDGGWYDAAFYNWKNERYLVQTDSGLETTASYTDRTVFAQANQICGIQTNVDGSAYIIKSNYKVPFVTSRYWVQGGPSLNAFVYNGWFLASDSTGNVYLTKNLVDECYWILTQ